jgi:ABC-2 type transport system ATP-binding protein
MHRSGSGSLVSAEKGPESGVLVDKIKYLTQAFSAYCEADLAGAVALFAQDAMWLGADRAASGCRDLYEIETMLRRGIERGITGKFEELIEIGDTVVVSFKYAHGIAPVGDSSVSPHGLVYYVLRFDGPTVVRSECYLEREYALHAAADPRRPREAILALDSVTKRFRRTVAIRDVSLEVCRGEAVAIVGENGAGKSTLLRISAGLEVPDEGTVRLTAPVGYCPQEPALFDLLTADEHVVLFCAGQPGDRSAAVDAGRGMLAALGFPAGSRALARDMSGGERQKLNLALALIGEPGLLLLDEPYQGFDHGSYLDFWHFVDTWRDDGKGVVIVTHLLTELHRVDRVIELQRPCRKR